MRNSFTRRLNYVDWNYREQFLLSFAVEQRERDTKCGIECSIKISTWSTSRVINIYSRDHERVKREKKRVFFINHQCFCLQPA